MNKVILIGRFVRNPERKETNRGLAYTSFTLAVQKTFKNNNGQYDTDFIPCRAWGKTAEHIVQFCQKGTLVAVAGFVTTYTYSNPKGEKQFVTEITTDRITFLTGKRNEKVESTEEIEIEQFFNV